ncbi:MAG: bifunctional folylpolyglutamate synthase/dihydrofolate synthase [Tannerellaceae bacterium]|jgi:dihydrofolate synthase/folylpolyglutamate synthase|nr:bifunctional folylpolyglutamate synthase/dihydrofolate synthase [Tannerellaceae bacterium]
MTYQQTLNYLYSSTPVFENHGAGAYKPGLDTAKALDNYLNHPHTTYKTIHVAGTNGKGSVCHTLAAILQEAGYKVGLYTSPHLLDFSERIRVNGSTIEQKYVVDFVEKHREFFEPLHPSFFELTTAMAFDYFRHKQVEIALIEVGLGGRLDSTNIIMPILCIITNITKDHTDLLGSSLSEIAIEKAGIIKAGIPVVVGDAKNEAVKNVFIKKATEMHAPLSIMDIDDPNSKIHNGILETFPLWKLNSTDFGLIEHGIPGFQQGMNVVAVLGALRVLSPILGETGQKFVEAVRAGFKNVLKLTGLRGRWDIVSSEPTFVIDVGHNPGAWDISSKILTALASTGRSIHIVLGFSSDKDIDTIFGGLPATPNVTYLFVEADNPRAVPAKALLAKAEAMKLSGEASASVADALRHLQSNAAITDFIFISGSHYVAAEAYSFFDSNPLFHNL